ncbi:probable plastid-lipid-associated protein 11, chloroplasti [Coccomyxa sp. Obi]|nr:probable plastid-lipid-associated protein 11, chloroplasti [Coccomyxa sp. Obi]
MSVLHVCCTTQPSLPSCLPLPYPRIHAVRGTVRISCGLLDTFNNGIFNRTRGGQSIAAETRLLSAIKDTERGLKTPPSTREDILQAVNELEEIGKGTVTTGTGLSATWKLLWTTEKETLFILKNAGWFGTEAGEVFQVIDVGNGSLNNVITFPPDGAFIVDSSLDVVGEQRTNFKFRGAQLKLSERSISLPPFGQGWFDTIYLGRTLRVAKDIRGDTLVVERDGPPRSFS